MTDVRYTPAPSTGGSLLVVAGRGMVVLGEGASDAAALAIRGRLAAGEGFAAVVDALAAGGSLAHLPPFVVVVDEDATWRVGARGGLAAEVVTASGTEIVDGAGASTWSERSILGVERVTVGADAADAALPLADGVVRAAAVVVSLAGGAAPGAVRAAVPTAGRAPEAIEPVQPHSAAEVREVEAGSVEQARAAEASPEPAPAARRADDSQTLIDSIPPFVLGAALQSWRSPAAPVPTPAAVPEASVPPIAGEGVGDDLEATVVAERPARGRGADPAVAPTPAPAPPVAGDHDGQTLSLEEVRRLRAAGAVVPPPPPPTVAQAVPAELRGPIGRLRLSTGQVVPLDRAVVVGRRPRSTRASGAELPHLIGVDSPQQDISRNHVEVRVEQDTILATDLQTTNGTSLQRAGSPTTRLHPGEATVVVAGDVLDIGDGVTIAVEALS